MKTTSHGPEFKHRPNPNGTFDSFCLCCFLTIATESSEGSLTELEMAHQCSGIFSFPSHAQPIAFASPRILTPEPVAG